MKAETGSTPGTRQLSGNSLSPRARRVVFCVLLVLATAAFVAMSMHRFETTGLHVDEVYWAGEGIYFKLFFLDRDFDHPMWTAYWGQRNPPLVKYVYGLALFLTGNPITDLELRSAFGRYWRDTKQLHEHIPPGVLPVVRITSWIFGTLCLGLMALLGWKLAGRYMAVIVVFAVSFDRLLMTYFVRGMSESIVIFLSLLFLWASLRFFELDSLKVRSRDKVLAVVAVAGSIGALSLAKPSGPLAGLIFCALAAAHHGLQVRGARQADGGVRHRILRPAAEWVKQVLFVGLVSFALLLTFNPYLHSEPLNRLNVTLEVWDAWRTEAENGEDGLREVPEKLEFYSTHSFPLGYGSTGIGRWANIGVLLIGMVCLLRQGIETTGRTGRLAPQFIFLIWGCGYSVAQIVWIPRSWPRYVLISHPFVILAQSAALYFALKGAVGLAQSLTCRRDLRGDGATSP